MPASATGTAGAISTRSATSARKEAGAAWGSASAMASASVFSFTGQPEATTPTSRRSSAACSSIVPGVGPAAP